MLRGPAAGKYTEGRLWLTENCRLPRGKAHVTRQHELATGGAYTTFDLRDCDQAAGTQIPKQECD
jgi:hypothetical protein